MPFDKHITPTPELLHASGILDHAGALKNIESLCSRFGKDGFGELAPALFGDLGTTADPDMALNNLERFVNALPEIEPFMLLCKERRDVLRALMTIFGASRFLSTFLIIIADESLSFLADPDYLAHAPGKERLSERLASMMNADADEKPFYHALRLFRRQQMLRIALRDLLGKADLSEVVRELSDLAEVCLERAYKWADAGLQKRYGRPMLQHEDGTNSIAGFSVIAMGKLGGNELNFSSDVDLMYVYTADGETEGARSADGGLINRITNHQYFIKLAERMSAAINEKTEDGFVFRVDLRLRPEGQRGPLAQSLGGYEIYYESWGQTWERSALIKARPVAGDEAVGREFLDRITPFVYRKYLDYTAITEIREMKQKINEDVRQKGKTHRDVKLGYGGIREIEFIIQAIQLIYGGRDRSLREKTALKALHALSQKGLITYQEHDVLLKAYVFLRTVEHRLQMLDDLQTQTMPLDERELRALARRTGYLDQGREAELLLRDYTEHTQKVRAVYDNLFGFTGAENAEETRSREYTALLDPDTPEPEAIALLTKAHFLDPGKAYRNLFLLREGPAFVHQTPRSRRLFNETFPALFQEIINSPDPDMALNHLESFLATQGSWETVQLLVRLHASAARVLIAVFANSAYLSRILVSRPELLQNLLESRRFMEKGASARFTRELGEALERAADITAKLDALRRFKHQEEIRIGMADLLSSLPITMVSRELSKLAEACLDAALRLAASELAKRFNASPVLDGLAIIGVGKLGGRELSYGSDLDILFVFSEPRDAVMPQGLSLFEYFSKIAEKTISYLSTLTREGFVFRIDTRLRPTGSKGPLVQSIEAFKKYYASQAETWELQALVRARFAAGDPVVGAEFRRGIEGLIFRDADQAALGRDVLAMRKRMEEELGKESAEHYNIKQGVGGLVDIEFLVQYLQLLHGKQHCWARVPGTYNALRALHKEKLLADVEYQTLLRAYLFLRRIESRMRIVSNQASSFLSRKPEALYALARRMGYADDEGASAGMKLLAEYEQLSKQVRSIFTRTVLADAGSQSTGKSGS